MTLDERYDRTRKFVYRQRRRLPAVFVAAGSVALLFSTPFMICDGPVFGALCLACSCAGFWVRWQALAQTAYRRRRMKADPAAFAEPFPVEGIHSRVRYPLHAGGFLVWLGPVLFTGVGWFMVSASLAYALCVWLAISGEEALRLEKYGEPYRVWCDATPAVIPDFGKPGRPAPGRLRAAALRRDATVFWSAAAAFVWLGALKFRMVDLSWHIPAVWTIAGGGVILALIFSVLLRPSR